jgi:hypothetical protein
VVGKQQRRVTREHKVEAVRLALSGSKPQMDDAKDLSLSQETQPTAQFVWDE